MPCPVLSAPCPACPWAVGLNGGVTESLLLSLWVWRGLGRGGVKGRRREKLAAVFQRSLLQTASRVEDKGDKKRGRRRQAEAEGNGDRREKKIKGGDR